MARLEWVLHVVVGVVLVLGGLSANATLERYSGLLTVIGLGFGYYSFVLNLYYNRNPRVYGLVNRVLLSIRRDHTYWELSIAFIFEPRSPDQRCVLLSTIESRLREKYVGRVQVTRVTMEHMEMTIDNLIGLIFHLEAHRLALSLDRRLTVPVHAYAEYQHELFTIADAIQEVVKPDDVICDVQVYFRRGQPNPFYGFFVCRVPSKLVEAFHVVFRMDRCPDCRIEASTDHVGVHANSLAKMFACLDEVLSFRALPASVETK